MLKSERGGSGAGNSHDLCFRAAWVATHILARFVADLTKSKLRSNLTSHPNF